MEPLQASFSYLHDSQLALILLSYSFYCSQLGNAYFYMGDYVKAMQYHKHDLTLARTMGDRLGEAKASGNLGNTLKVMGKFEEAVICCRRHLEICQEHRDRVGEGRALYNLGNVYHAKVSLRVMLILKMISKQF